MKFRFFIILSTFLCVQITLNAQDILTTRNNIDSMVVFDKAEGNYIYYRDYNNPDSKQIKNLKRNYTKVRLANGQVIWFTMRPNYTRFRVGCDIGAIIPLGDLRSGSEPISPDNTPSYLGFYFTKRIYKLIDLQLKFWGAFSNYDKSSLTHIENRSWSNFGTGLGPNFTFKLSSRFYAEVPILYTFSQISNSLGGFPKYTVTNSNYLFSGETISGNGWGSGICTGVSLNMRLSQRMGVGVGTNFHSGRYQMNYHHLRNDTSGYLIDDSSLVKSWSYFTANIRANIHF